jgi:uncharacterized repeat protein (TIGR03803 family)
MRSQIKKSSGLTVLTAAFAWILPNQVTAQTFTVLHHFTATSTNSVGAYTNSDGIFPRAILSAGGTLYGVAEYGGASGNGTVFSIKTDGTGFTTLHNFSATANSIVADALTNSDGTFPTSLVVSGSSLYGTAQLGGAGGNGTIFKLNRDGTGFTVLHAFAANADGTVPGGLTISGNLLYGITGRTVFQITQNGTEFATLHGLGSSSLAISGINLYGATSGEVFKVNTNGTGLTNAIIFPFSGNPLVQADPSGLVVSGDSVYGTWVDFAEDRFGSAYLVNVFKLNQDGTGWTNLNRVYDGRLAVARSPLQLNGNTLYGTVYDLADPEDPSSFRLNAVSGSAFALSTDGSALTILHHFDGPIRLPNADGTYPSALAVSDNALYGTAELGGSSGNGTVFSLSFAPQLSVTSSRTNVGLTWPTNYVGFDFTGYTLQSTTNLVTPVWATSSLVPAVVNGQKMVTAPVEAAQQFFRLRQ